MCFNSVLRQLTQSSFTSVLFFLFLSVLYNLLSHRLCLFAVWYIAGLGPLGDLAEYAAPYVSTIVAQKVREVLDGQVRKRESSQIVCKKFAKFLTVR